MTTVTNLINLHDGADTPIPMHVLRDAIALTVHELLSTPDESTRRDVEYPGADDQPILVETVDPYVWDVTTFALVALNSADTLTITATCEPEGTKGSRILG